MTSLLWEKLIATGVAEEKSMKEVIERLYNEGKIDNTALQSAVDDISIEFTQADMDEIIAS